MSKRFNKTYLDFKQPRAGNSQPSVNRRTFELPKTTIHRNYHRANQQGISRLRPFSVSSISAPPKKVMGRIIFYGLACLAISWIWSYQSSEHQKIDNQKQQIAIEQQQAAENLQKFISTYNAPAKQVASEGIELLKGKNFALAGAYLARAGELDSNLRDAFVYSGFAYIELANQAQNTEKSTELAQKALHQLETASRIDPLHSYTFELLAFTYDFLGQADAANSARAKAQTVAIN